MTTHDQRQRHKSMDCVFHMSSLFIGPSAESAAMAPEMSCRLQEGIRGRATFLRQDRATPAHRPSGDAVACSLPRRPLCPRR